MPARAAVTRVKGTMVESESESCRRSGSGRAVAVADGDDPTTMPSDDEQQRRA